MTKPLKPIVERQPLSTVTVHDNPIINRVLQNRGISSHLDMDYALRYLESPFSMKGMSGAVALLEAHVRKNSKIIIVGDYDCDGATSTSIAVAGLRMMGAQNVDFVIPDRRIHGYGLTPSIVQLVAEHEPDLIVTVDNGISSFDGAEAVRNLEKPCQLLVTDHHLASDKGIPQADEVVNPNQPGCPFPSKNLAGCGVIFYVIMALRAHLRDVGFFAEKGMELPNIAVLLDMVALGTVADVVILDRNNRILVESGLQRIRMGYARPGIKALIDISGRDAAKLKASDMGFNLGPRINAAGRLDDMTIGVQCLLSDNYEQALEIAERLNDLNVQRREIEALHTEDATVLIEKHNLTARKGVVLFESSWHHGVVGIVASRIKEKLNRPIICMADTDEAAEKRQELQMLTETNAPQELIDKCRNELLSCEVKGSARSIEGIHLKHILDHINKKHPEVLYKFGGHAMAAGLSLKYQNLEKFIELFDAEVAKEITEEQIIGSIVVDIMNVDANQLTMELAEEIQRLGPWGQMFPEPNFHAKFIVVKEPFIMKKKHAKFALTVEGSNQIFEGVAFNIVDQDELPVKDVFEAAFVLDINEYKGNRTLQLLLRDVQPCKNELTLQNQAAQEAGQPETMATEQQMAATITPEAGGAESAAANSSIKGLYGHKEVNPMKSLRSDMDMALDAIFKARRRTVTLTSDDPAPF